MWHHIRDASDRQSHVTAGGQQTGNSDKYFRNV